MSASLRHALAVRALFDDSPIVENDNLIRLPDLPRPAYRSRLTDTREQVREDA